MDYDIQSNARFDRLQQDMTRRRKLVKKLKDQELEVTSRPSNRQTYPDYNAPDRNTAYSPQLPPLQLTISPTIPYHHPAIGITAPSPSSIAMVPYQSPPRDSRETKSGIMDLMMLQNAQLSQIVMHRMALSAIQPETTTMMTQSTGTRTKINIRLDELLSHMRRNDDDYDDLYFLPPIQMLPAPVFYEAQPLRVPNVTRRRKRSPKAPVQRPRPIKRRLPYPLTGPLKRFRTAAIAVLFSVSLEHQRRKNEHNPRRVPRMNESFLFGIRLRESISAIHHIFLSSENNIFQILRKVLDDRKQDLTVALKTDGGESSQQDNQNVISELAIIMENAVFEITEIMPKRGVLGTQRKSTTYKMIQPETVYPKGYFWQMEKDLLGVDSTESLKAVSVSDASVLIIGHFLGRGLIVSLLLKPQEFRLVAPSASLHHGAERNLRFLASLFFYLLRKVYTSLKTTNDLVNRPSEYDHLLYDDSELEPAIGTLSKSFTYAENLLSTWAKEYIRRLRRIR